MGCGWGGWGEGVGRGPCGRCCGGRETSLRLGGLVRGGIRLLPAEEEWVEQMVPSQREGGDE